MKKVILDTNFLLIPLQFRVDIFSEFNRICNFNYELCVIDKTINELMSITEKQSGKQRRAAQFALKLIKLKNIKILKSTQKDVDSAILNAADNDAIAATQDTELKRKLIKKSAPLIILRQRKYLQLLEGKLYK